MHKKSAFYFRFAPQAFLLFTACFFSCLLTHARSFAAPEDPLQTGSWKVMQENSVYWLKSPEGMPFYSKGVNCVDGWDENKNLTRPGYYWGNFFQSKDQWRQAADELLTAWGFNTRGGWSDASCVFSLPLIVELDLGRTAKLHWFDPFDPAMDNKTFQAALELTAPFRNDPRLMGYFTDNEAGWWNGPLFTWYLKEGWENHTKRELWTLLFSHYKGNLSGLLADFVPDAKLKSFEDLKKKGARLSLRPGGQGIRLINRFTYSCARRYYELVYHALRRAHPGALVMGDRLPLYYHQDAAMAMADMVDVVSTNYNVDVPDGWIAPYYFEGLFKLTGGKPVLVSEFFFAARENRSGNRNNGHLMTVQTQAERAQGAAAAMVNFARFPNVVGAHWFQQYDEPTGGRRDGEDYNMGLIDINNRPYEELTERFKQVNQGLDAAHRAGRFSSAAGPSSQAEESLSPVSLKRAAYPLSLADGSLVDWQHKEETRLTGFQAPAPYVPFGDVHMAWSPKGLYLFCLASNYYDPSILAYKGDFPLSEAFQLHLNVAADGSQQHYAIYLIPQKSSRFRNEREIMPKLFLCNDAGPVRVLPAEGRVQQIVKPLPHIAVEAFFPVQMLGVQELKAGQKIRLNVWAAKYFCELTMTWAGVPQQSKAELSKSFREVILE
ncbi:MAG: hypothetical protein WCQ99_04285 [Pseudomonadota bacterium]